MLERKAHGSLRPLMLGITGHLRLASSSMLQAAATRSAGYAEKEQQGTNNDEKNHDNRDS